MDHSQHGAGMVDGHDHMDHSPVDTSPMCSMNMLFTWDTTNLCVVFRWWHVQTPIGLFLTLASVTALTAFYEYIRWISRRVDASYHDTIMNTDSTKRHRLKLSRALVYGFQVFYSFLLMLVFMTYNGWVMVAVGVGAVVGFYIWGERQPTSGRAMACH